MDLHKRCKLQLKFYQEYVDELEGRIKGFMRYMIEKKQSNEKFIDV